MKTALAKAEQGPDALRWYVQRTKSIYGLDYSEVMNAYTEAQTAKVQASSIAEASKR